MRGGNPGVTELIGSYITVLHCDTTCQAPLQSHKWEAWDNLPTCYSNCLFPRWRHQIKTFPRYWPFVRGIHRWPMNFPHKGQWRGAFFSLIYAWINDWVNNLGDFRRHCANNDVTVMPTSMKMYEKSDDESNEALMCWNILLETSLPLRKNLQANVNIFFYYSHLIKGSVRWDSRIGKSEEVYITRNPISTFIPELSTQFRNGISTLPCARCDEFIGWLIAPTAPLLLINVER